MIVAWYRIIKNGTKIVRIDLVKYAKKQLFCSLK